MLPNMLASDFEGLDDSEGRLGAVTALARGFLPVSLIALIPLAFFALPAASLPVISDNEC